MHRIVVLLPDPFGPRKPVTVPGLHIETEVIDCGGATESFREVDDADHVPALPTNSLATTLRRGTIGGHPRHQRPKRVRRQAGADGVDRRQHVVGARVGGDQRQDHVVGHQRLVVLQDRDGRCRQRRIG